MRWEIAVIFAIVALSLLIPIRKRKKWQAVRCGDAEAGTSKPPRMRLALKNLRLARAQMAASNSQEFARLLSRALRIYILSAYKLPSMRTTSEEIINRLLADATNDWSTIGLAAEIFRLADSAKYSPRRLSLPQQRGIYKKSCTFVLLSERFFRK
ncbi:MAG: hypothetical protein LBI61_00010 [Puniceicoccales bacterium]|jgi:hypothetical protein|nr:hypothetical protein [Puniceicoccales bacterium]